jgi:tetratricopeptide (TPR) repeat protein
MISLSMIVKDEEATLGHCLGSVRLLVDEMVVVDTGSADGTAAIAEGFGARVHRFRWSDDFSAARNEALRRVRGDWVLVLDADEAIDELDHDKIRAACREPYADAYSLTTRNYTATAVETTLDVGAVPNAPGSGYSEGAGLPFYTDNTGLRLARVFDGLAFEGSIHETMGKSLVARGKTIEPLPAVIHHYGKLLAGREKQKAGYYLELARRDAAKNPKDKWALFNLLQQALVARDWGLALQAAEASLKLGQAVETLVLYGAGVACQQLGRHADALKHFHLLTSHAPGHALAVLGKGVSLDALGDPAGGRELMERAIRLQPGYVPAHCALADLEARQGNHGAARRIAAGALRMAPREPALHDALLKIELSRGDAARAAEDALRAIEACPGGGQGRWHRLAAVHRAQAGQRAAALSILEAGLKEFPGDPDLERLKKLV